MASEVPEDYSKLALDVKLGHKVCIALFVSLLRRSICRISLAEFSNYRRYNGMAPTMKNLHKQFQVFFTQPGSTSTSYLLYPSNNFPVDEGAIIYL